ncbi:uncharacterized protein A4U43_C07F30250 [Asparagus officinalis]|uniref:Cytoplasmic tRNA 2-thiolation protein 2 n=1 Tax=Asparagus officinalis TaxID=4686 RepID=A0A5P1EFZ3_ASPOF|nr:uncharacterized protein A4U43_C07F30250 [Asparagus officinalis]
MASCGGRGGGGGGACQSNCSRSEDDDAANQIQIEETLPNLSINGGGGGGRLCSKCGEMEQDYNGMCTACFRSFLFGKFKLAVTTNAMISPTDNVLVAFSGGPASRVALQFIHEMQCKALKSWDASKSQALPVFGVGVAFIDESAVSSNPSREVDQALKEIRLIVSDLGSPHKELHITPIESIYSLDCIEGRNRLKELLLTISDVTGKEDFLQHLRISSLQKIALENNYNKLVLGSCTSRIARHILSSTVKGQGYSLPADLQYVDSRWEVPIVLPLRDCVAQELRMLCFLDSLKTQQLLDRPSSGINDLVSLFVARLQDDNPSRERTIVRTAEKLKPFCFNKFVEHGYHDFLPSRLRPKFQNVEDTESNPSEHLCPIW